MRPRERTKDELVRQWLAKAEQDAGVAEHLLSERLYYSAVGYHAQQACEKYLKAFLVEHQVEFPKTHDLGLLLDLVASVSPDLADSLGAAIVLSDYSVDARYPGDLPEVGLAEAKHAVELASQVKLRVMEALRGVP
jgi:HEPN domain-containing protein